MTKRRRAWGLAALVGIAIVGIAILLARVERGSGSVTGSDSGSDSVSDSVSGSDTDSVSGSDTDSVSGSDTDSVSGSDTDSDPDSASTAPLPRPRAPEPRSVDPCAETERGPERHDRLDEIVNARLAELRDRARLALADPATSPELRAALEGVLARGETDLALVERAARARDRLDDGFDHAAALALTLAVRLDRAGSPAARGALALATRLAPADPAPHVLAAIGRAHAGDRAGFRESLAEAFARDREEPAIAIELAHALARTVESERVVEILAAYLAVYPDDPEASRFRARMQRRLEGVGPAELLRRGGVTLAFPRGADRARLDETARTVADALDDAARLLGLPRREELAVLVHRDRAAMQRAMCGQTWTAAAYDGVLHVDLETLADPRLPSGERAAVLRHECLHAALHDTPREVPYWLDEGLAQHFAPREDPGILESYAHLARDRTFIPFASLNGAFLDIDDADDARLAYHQSLAMIEWLVARRGERGIAELVARVLADGERADVTDPAAVLSEVGRARFDGEALLDFLGVTPRSPSVGFHSASTER